MISRIHITVFGNVHGVFFRANTVAEARKLGLTGYVRNNPNGSVEIVAEGEEEALKNLLEWSRKGPEAATVKNVKYEWITAKGEFDEFNVRF